MPDLIPHLEALLAMVEDPDMPVGQRQAVIAKAKQALALAKADSAAKVAP